MTKAKATKKRKGTDIPLKNIPDRERAGYSIEMKKQAVERLLKGETGEAIARDMGISTSSLIHKWARVLEEGLPLVTRGVPHSRDPMNMIRAEMERAAGARDQRLETAAMIVELDGKGPQAHDIAKRIRQMKTIVTGNS